MRTWRWHVPVPLGARARCVWIVALRDTVSHTCRRLQLRLLQLTRRQLLPQRQPQTHINCDTKRRA